MLFLVSGVLRQLNRFENAAERVKDCEPVSRIQIHSLRLRARVLASGAVVAAFLKTGDTRPALMGIDVETYLRLWMRAAGHMVVSDIEVPVTVCGLVDRAMTATSPASRAGAKCVPFGALPRLGISSVRVR
jgi:hypothetical protein